MMCRTAQPDVMLRVGEPDAPERTLHHVGGQLGRKAQPGDQIERPDGRDAPSRLGAARAGRWRLR